MVGTGAVNWALKMPSFAAVSACVPSSTKVSAVDVAPAPDNRPVSCSGDTVGLPALISATVVQRSGGGIRLEAVDPIYQDATQLGVEILRECGGCLRGE